MIVDFIIDKKGGTLFHLPTGFYPSMPTTILMSTTDKDGPI